MGKKRAREGGIGSGAYVRHVLMQFWSAFRDVDRRYLFMVLYDSVFLFVLGLLIQLSGVVLQWLKGMVAGIDIDKATIVNQTVAQLDVTKAQIQQFMLVSALAVLVFALLALAAYALFKGLIWVTVFRERHSAAYYKKFFLLNVVWTAVWILPWAGLVLLMRPDAVQAFVLGAPNAARVVVVGFVVLVLVHPLTVLHSWFTMHPKSIRAALKAVFTLGFGRLHKFVVPYVLCGLVYVVVSMVALFVNRMLGLDARMGTAVLFLAAVLFINWFKIYMSSVVREVVRS